jgi:lysophospholipase L1-like esterase
LRALGKRERGEHVRVLWLGDSHTNADFLSGAVRSELQSRFGDGGPGFVRVGLKAYRHDGLRLSRDGSWNVDPDPPARRTLQGDGVFGLGGTRAIPGADASFTLQPLVAAPLAQLPARFELAFRLSKTDAFAADLDGRGFRIDSATPCESGVSGISHVSLSAPYASSLVLTPLRGAPQLLHVIVERTDRAGLVLDAVGIDGARLETPLAWEEAAFVNEVTRRAPELFVVAYGTNESFDALRVDKYGPQLQQLVGRLRRGAPAASCLVLGPTDAPLGEGSVPRVAEVSSVLGRTSEALGCSYVSLQQLMGGEGSFARAMKAKERLAQLDRLHLTPRGYRELGAALLQQLLGAYSAGRADL